MADPTNPTEIGAFATQGDARDVVVDEDYAYVISASGTLDIVDASDLTAPILVGSFDLKGRHRASDGRSFSCTCLRAAVSKVYRASIFPAFK